MEKQTLLEWLNMPCPIEDLVPVPDKKQENVYYMPIAVLNKKLRFAEKEFGLVVNQFNFIHFLHNTKTSIIVSGSIALSLIAENFHKSLIGAATFDVVDYAPNFHFGATVKSLAKVNALSSEYPQFGSDYNTFDITAIKETELPLADIVNVKMMQKAVADNDQLTIDNLLKTYLFA